MDSLLDTVQSALEGVSIDRAEEAIRAFIDNPTANPIGAIGVMIAVVLLLLVIVLAVLYVLMPPQRRLVTTRTYAAGKPTPAEPATAADDGSGGEIEAMAGKKRPGRSKAALFLGSGLGTFLFVLLAVVALYVATSTDRYCFEACHWDSRPAKAASEIAHARCSDCHEPVGIAAAVSNSLSRTQMVVTQFSALGGYKTAPVSSDSCIKCHRAVLRDTVTGSDGVRVSHKEMLVSGGPCTACHENVGHSADVYDRGMNPCIVCHDGTTAFADCSGCHDETAEVEQPDPGLTAQELSSGSLTYSPVDASRPYCDDCHDVARECDPCHGVRMPHDDAFILGGHARPAAFEGKQGCWKCHDPQQDCGGPCHTGFERDGISGHADNWKTDHGVGATTGGCGCHQHYSGRAFPMCDLCH